jgi:hypothetical protein
MMVGLPLGGNCLRKYSTSDRALVFPLPQGAFMGDDDSFRRSNAENSVRYMLGKWTISKPVLRRVGNGSVG